ncbi:MAG: GAF domain-containing protein, partial [Chloroflexota bacterium]
PISVRGKAIGRLEIADVWNKDVEAGEVVTAIAEQLSAHIETLRLSEQTQAALGEAEQAHREAERRATELAAINRVVAVAASSFNLQAILGATASEIVQVLNARNSGIALLDDSRQNLTVIADHNISPDEASAAGVAIPLANNPSSTRVIETRRSLVIANAQTNPLTEPIHALLRERQTQCLMIVPLLARGEAIGTIGVDTTDPDRTFTSAEVSLVETIAGQLAGAIENVHLFEEVERHGTELRALFAAMTDVVLIYDKEGRYVRIAPTNPSLLYRLPDDMIGKTIHEVMPRAKADELFAYIQQALETRQSVNAEYQLDIGEASLWFYATVTPLGEDKVFWIARDITERKQAENALAKHAVELETVARVSTAASSVLQVEALLQEVVDLTRSSFNLYHAHIYLLDETGDILALSAGAG